MTVSERVSLVCAILSLVLAILIGVWQIYQNHRVNKLTLQQSEIDQIRYDNVLYSEATKFILKYSSAGHDSQILLLPLCVMAYKYSPIYPYSREMYREFCTLSEELQVLILKRCGLALETGRCENFFESQVMFLKSIIKDIYSGDADIFYEGAKYFERALKNHGSCDKPEITCAVDVYQQEAYDSGIWLGPKPAVMDYDEHITNLLCYEKDGCPITRLFREDTSMGPPDNSDEILTSYLCCKVAAYVPYCLNLPDEFLLDTGYVCDFSGVQTMEDFFLTALFHIYCYGGYESKSEGEDK